MLTSANDDLQTGTAARLPSRLSAEDYDPTRGKRFTPSFSWKRRNNPTTPHDPAATTTPQRSCLQCSTTQMTILGSGDWWRSKIFTTRHYEALRMQLTPEIPAMVCRVWNEPMRYSTAENEPLRWIAEECRPQTTTKVSLRVSTNRYDPRFYIGFTYLRFPTTLNERPLWVTKLCLR